MKNQPDITVVLPVFNGMKYIKECIESILDQDFQNFELIICDDCSTDDSYRYITKINDARVKIYKNNVNIGLFKTLNKLIDLSQANFIHLFSQDDIMCPDCLKETVKFNKRFPDLPLSYSNLYHIDSLGLIIKEGELHEGIEYISDEHHSITSILSGSMPGNIANVTLKKAHVQRAGYFDEGMKFAGDFDLWCRLSNENGIGYINKRLIKLRSHSEQLSRQDHMQIYWLREVNKVLRDFYPRLNKKDIRRADFSLKWRTQTSFFDIYISMLFRSQLEYSKQYFKELRNEYAIFPLLARWLIVRSLRTINLEKKIYSFFVYK